MVFIQKRMLSVITTLETMSFRNDWRNKTQDIILVHQTIPQLSVGTNCVSYKFNVHNSDISIELYQISQVKGSVP